MTGEFDWNLVAAALFGLLMLIFLVRVFYKPLKILLRILLWTVMGGTVIYLYNLIGAGLGPGSGVKPDQRLYCRGDGSAWVGCADHAEVPSNLAAGAPVLA